MSFFFWLAFTGVHVLGHLPEVQRTLSGGREMSGAVLAGAQGRVDGYPTGPGYESDLHDLRAGRAGRGADARSGGLRWGWSLPWR